MFLLGYYENELNWIHYIQLVFGLAFILIGVFWYKRFYFNNSSISFSDDLITCTIKGKELKTSWKEYNALKLTGNGLTLQFSDNHQQSIDLRWMDYAKRQEIKNHLAQIAEEKNVSFNY